MLRLNHILTIQLFNFLSANQSSTDLAVIGSFNAVTLLEPIYTTAAVDQLLASCIERMALGTYFHFKLTFDRAGFKRLATGTAHYALAIVRMYVLLHLLSPLVFYC